GDDAVDDGEPDDLTVTAPRRRPGWLTDLRPSRDHDAPPDATPAAEAGAELLGDRTDGDPGPAPGDGSATNLDGGTRGAEAPGASRPGAGANATAPRRGRRAQGPRLAAFGAWSLGAGALALLLAVAV